MAGARLAIWLYAAVAAVCLFCAAALALAPWLYRDGTARVAAVREVPVFQIRKNGRSPRGTTLEYEVCFTNPRGETDAVITTSWCPHDNGEPVRYLACFPWVFVARDEFDPAAHYFGAGVFLALFLAPAWAARKHARMLSVRARKEEAIRRRWAAADRVVPRC